MVPALSRSPPRAMAPPYTPGWRPLAPSIVCVLDGDGSLDPGQLPMLVDLVRAGADLAVGRRRSTGRSGWPLHARLGNAVSPPGSGRGSVFPCTTSEPCARHGGTRCSVSACRTGGRVTHSSCSCAPARPASGSKSETSRTVHAPQAGRRSRARCGAAPWRRGTS